MKARRGHRGDEPDHEVIGLEHDGTRAVLPRVLERELERAVGVIGLSLQSTLGNLIGGLALHADDSVREGDWIELENMTQGQVKKVRWRHTVIETRDWDTLIVPNNQLLVQTIKILGRREGEPVQHRMWVYFNVDHRFRPRDVIRVVDEALQSAPFAGVAAEPKPHAICHDFAKDNRDSFAYYAVRYWLSDMSRDDPTSSAVRERVYAALQRAQIPLAAARERRTRSALSLLQVEFPDGRSNTAV